MDPNENQPKSEEKKIATSEIIEIDGSHLEGGGQILRISLAIAAIFGKNLRIYNIRGKRNPPGLKNQHSAVSEALAKITGGKLLNSNVGSKEMSFYPTNLKEVKLDLGGKTHVCDANTAGSIGLMIQQLLPCLILAKEKCKLELIGGTIVSHSPPVFYITHVLTPILSRMNVAFTMNVVKHGIFPIGQGRVLFETQPCNSLLPLNIEERGKLTKVIVRLVSTKNFSIVNCTQIFKNLVKDVKKSVKAYLKKFQKMGEKIEKPTEEDLKDEEIDFENLDQEDKLIKELFVEDFVDISRMKKGSTLFAQVILHFENTIVSTEQMYSEKKEKPEIKQFKSEFLQKFDESLFNANLCLDEFTVDHIIIFLAFAKGKSVINVGKLSLHTLTAIDVIKKFVPELKVKIEEKAGFTRLEIEGIGYLNDV